MPRTLSLPSSIADASATGPALVTPPGQRPPSGWSPLVEIALFIGCMLVADVTWGAGDRFTHVEPHPLWIIVLLMAVHYGTKEALIATAAASAALLLGNLPPQSLEQNVHDYAVQVLLRPLLWMLASLVLGELRVRHRLAHDETTEHMRNAERQVALLSRSHKELTAAKDRLETKLAGQLRTATGLFEAARTLETLEPDKVMAGATELVSIALHARAFSMFLLNGDTLVLAAAHGWSQSTPYPGRYAATTPLFREVVGAQRVVTVSTAAGEAALDGHGLIAGPLVEPGTGTLVGMLKIEDMAFLDFNLSSLQTFKTLTEWIAAAYQNAVAHKASQVQDDVTRLYGMKYLDRQTAYVTELARRFGFDLTLLLFRVDVEVLTDSQRRDIPAALGEVARRVLRQTDLAFFHEPPGTQFAVLLPGAPSEHASIVARKIQDGLNARCGYDVPCTTDARSLCQARESESRQVLRADAAAPDLVA